MAQPAGAGVMATSAPCRSSPSGPSWQAVMAAQSTESGGEKRVAVRLMGAAIGPVDHYSPARAADAPAVGRTPPQARLTGLYPGSDAATASAWDEDRSAVSVPLPWSAVAAAQQVENLALGVLDAVQAAVLQVERLLDFFKAIAVTTLRGRDLGNRAAGCIEQLVDVIDIVAQLAHDPGEPMARQLTTPMSWRRSACARWSARRRAPARPGSARLGRHGGAPPGY
jgi:hypothetical protein